MDVAADLDPVARVDAEHELGAAILAESALAYLVAIPPALLTAAANHLLAHWRDATGPAASFFSVEIASEYQTERALPPEL